MVSKLERLKWQLHEKKYNILFNYGIKRGLIKPYDDELLSSLRHIYCGGLPATILLLYAPLNVGHCCDRAKLITLGFGEDDFQVVNADIDSLTLNPRFIEEFRTGKTTEDYKDHCFVERTAKDGTTWVYDTTEGFAIEKSLYYRMERPKIRVKNNKAKTIEFLYEDFLRDSDINKDKYILPIALPIIEANLEATHPIYSEQLKEEIAILKKELDYDSICKENKKRSN